MDSTAAPSDEGPYNLRSDGEPGIDGYLGGFRAGHVVFTAYEIPPDRGRYPNGPTTYLVDVNDGVGARECCRFTYDPQDPVSWNRSWNGDEWCSWILEHTRRLIANPENT